MVLFTSNPDIYKNAYPNWQKTFRANNDFFDLYSEHFKEAADKLIDSIGANRGHIADNIINPALFLYRHSVELSLKAILHRIYITSGLDDNKIKEKLEGHGLESLWAKVNNEIRNKYNFGVDQNEKNELKTIGGLIIELHNTDDSSMTFRYPFDKRLDEFTYGDGKESFGIDFMHFKNQLDYLHSRLRYWIYYRVSGEWGNE
ncbi:hypothetical protein P4H27_00195 [Paenibacillus taichungensis]|uniref:hypothetical protein n=1 Tax=Paenibacillus taichungensis TaxID=484184 RepID=UPI002DBD3C35|nr:hypothetical protein [Paenibacillus taichungensis]MEC0105351.1 hypothetical protein [Paenibacillus taichungensis]MEC0200426.1 hypothetical protein [Paenibacillus taichungensis]